MANATTPVIQINEGNVGIGTITPASKLQVEDDSPTLILNHNGQASASQCEISARIFGYATPPIGTINWNTGYAGSNSTWSYYNQSTSTNNFLKLDQTDGFIVSLSGSEKMRVNQAGNVGIGVTAPTTGFKLHVQGNIRTSRIGSLDGSINIKNTITGQLNAGYSGVGAGDLVVGGSGTSSMKPAVITLINLDSSISANQDLGVIQFGGKDDNTTGYCNAQIIGTAKGSAGTGGSGGGHLRFLTATASTNDTPNERMRITDVGNLGIGTTSPGYKLDVSGTGRFTSTVTATNFILSSDKRLKNNVKQASNKHIDVNWKTFEMNSEEGQSRYGVIAQELEEVHPEFVRTDDEGMKSVAYIDLLIAKIAELEARLEKANI